MKLNSKPDDLCGNCLHEANLHGRSDGHADTLSCTWRHDSCLCREFVPPLFSRLVEALETSVRIEFLDGDRLRPIKWMEPVCDLLVELGKMEVKDGIYKWSAKP